MSKHRLLENPAIHALVRAEEVIKAAGEAQEDACALHVAIAVGEPLQLADVPCGRGTTRTLKIEYKLDEIVTSIATRTEPERRGEVFYATRLDDKGTLRL